LIVNELAEDGMIFVDRMENEMKIWDAEVHGTMMCNKKGMPGSTYATSIN